jgi:hypothetical protein
MGGGSASNPAPRGGVRAVAEGGWGSNPVPRGGQGANRGATRSDGPVSAASRPCTRRRPAVRYFFAVVSRVVAGVAGARVRMNAITCQI